MKYFQNPQNQVFGYDDSDPTQADLIGQAVTAGWIDITASWPPPLTNAQNITQQIIILERTVTQRRIRESVLGTDNGWLKALDAQIATLREQL